MSVATARRRFDPKQDARRGVYLADEGLLFEVVGVRGVDPTGATSPTPNAALLMLDCRHDAGDPIEEAVTAQWTPLDRLTMTARRVVPEGS